MDAAGARGRVPFAEHAGPIQCVATGRAGRLSLAVSGRHSNGRSTVHGGMIATLLDEAMGQLVESIAGVPGQTVELGVTYLIGVAAAGEVTAEAEIVRLGRSMAFAEGTVFDAEGRPAARGRAVFKLLRSACSPAVSSAE